jgi:hypothetical protein
VKHSEQRKKEEDPKGGSARHSGYVGCEAITNTVLDIFWLVPCAPLWWWWMVVGRNNPFAGCDVVAPDKRTHLQYDLVELPRYRGSTTLTSMSHFSGDLDWTFTFPFSTSLISCRALGFYHNT